MSEYVLITFYNRQTSENPSWEVYGHTAPGINDFMKAFKTRCDALIYSHSFCNAPVLEGTNKGHIVEKLT